MAFLSANERGFLRAVAHLGYCNPFLPERIQYEREALGSDFREAEPVWSMRVDDPSTPHVNAQKIVERVEKLVRGARGRLGGGSRPTEEDLVLYEDAVLFLVYHSYRDRLEAAIVRALDRKPGRGQVGFFQDFQRDWERYLHIPGVSLPSQHDPSHLFACFFQIRRAFHHIFSYIIGSSMAAARLRAAVWQSIFTHDMRRYRDAFYARMGDITTLITGPTGTGKELVARAIALSRYIPFDPKTLTFVEDFAESFYPLNLSALPATLIESELFGHRRGAFTGALQDRRGWLEICPQWGTVFLDEIGDLDASIQVKLLRVIQTRTFQPLGDTQQREFHGKIIAATNRDIGDAMRKGQFREDFYYRLCSDLVVTPALYEQLRESPGVLRELLLFIARRVAGPEAERLAEDVETWIVKHLGRDYPWPGNIRELEQCVRSILIRKEYRPAAPRRGSSREEFAAATVSGTLTADELLRRYCTLVYSQTGSYEETARRLQLDRRTVKSKIDPQFLAALRTPL
ncbi:MAG: sigma 54-interacting transcriptional regulator [Candidatus Methylomirabilales bacterium]